MGHGYGKHVRSHVVIASKEGAVGLWHRQWGQGNPAMSRWWIFEHVPQVSFAQVRIYCSARWDLSFQKLNFNSLTVDCGWGTWDAWAACTKEATGTCGVQGGGKTQRTRTKSFSATNGGVACEADSMEESWLCCANSTTDATGCTVATVVCLPGNAINSIIKMQISNQSSSICKSTSSISLEPIKY